DTAASHRQSGAVDPILIGKGEQPVYLLPRYGNRHGLVAGATGTGKTVSLLVMAEGFSRLGIPGVHGRREGRRGWPGASRLRHRRDPEARGADGIGRLRARGEPGRVLGSLR